MTDTDTVSEDEFAELEQAVAHERYREIAIEHLLFQTVGWVDREHPGLLDHLEASLDHLGDSADDETKSHEAVREVARLFIASLRRG